MDEVYRARDTRLNRDVALKILPDTFTHDPERVARFRREAHVLAALNHPHIAAIYGLDEANGSQFLVLELVDGESSESSRQARLPSIVTTSPIGSEFVDRGGYRNRSYWTEPFVENGRTLTWESAIARFVDQTGRPGPSTWEAGGDPDGRGDHPVTGVSWYEAVAYATFAGRDRASLVPRRQHRLHAADQPEPRGDQRLGRAWRKHLGRSVDYLQTRADIDASKLGYIGYSLGAEVAPILLAQDRRFSAAVLLSGGLTFILGKRPGSQRRALSAAHDDAGTHGERQYDSILPTATAHEPFFQQLGTPAAHKRRVVLDAGHTVTTPETHNALLKEALDWLDKYLR